MDSRLLRLTKMNTSLRPIRKAYTFADLMFLCAYMFWSSPTPQSLLYASHIHTQLNPSSPNRLMFVCWSLSKFTAPCHLIKWCRRCSFWSPWGALSFKCFGLSGLPKWWWFSVAQSMLYVRLELHSTAMMLVSESHPRWSVERI